jgi:hypothetical protein
MESVSTATSELYHEHLRGSHGVKEVSPEEGPRRSLAALPFGLSHATNTQQIIFFGGFLYPFAHPHTPKLLLSLVSLQQTYWKRLKRVYSEGELEFGAGKVWRLFFSEQTFSAKLSPPFCSIKFAPFEEL